MVLVFVVLESNFLSWLIQLVHSGYYLCCIFPYLTTYFFCIKMVSIADVRIKAGVYLSYLYTSCTMFRWLTRVLPKLYTTHK